MRNATLVAIGLVFWGALAASPATAMPGTVAEIGAGGTPPAIVDVRGGFKFRGRHHRGFGRGSISRGFGRRGFHQRDFGKRGFHRGFGQGTFRQRGFRKGRGLGGFGHRGKGFGRHHGLRSHVK